MSLEEELLTGFRALAPDGAVFEARRMRAVPKQAPGSASAGADLRAALAELRCALGSLASSRLPRSLRGLAQRAAAGQQPAPEPRQHQERQQQQRRRGDAEGAAAQSEQEAGMQAGDIAAGQLGTEGCGWTDADVGDAASNAAADTTQLAYLLLGESLTSHSRCVALAQTL